MAHPQRSRKSDSKHPLNSDAQHPRRSDLLRRRRLDDDEYLDVFHEDQLFDKDDEALSKPLKTTTTARNRALESVHHVSGTFDSGYGGSSSSNWSHLGSISGISSQSDHVLRESSWRYQSPWTRLDDPPFPASVAECVLGPSNFDVIHDTSHIEPVLPPPSASSPTLLPSRHSKESSQPLAEAQTFESVREDFEAILRQSSSRDASPRLSITQSALLEGSSTSLARALERRFRKVASGAWSWLNELAEMGYDSQEMAQLLIEQHEQSPLLPFDPWTGEHRLPDAKFHTQNCTHCHADVLSSPGTVVGKASYEPDDIVLNEFTGLRSAHTGSERSTQRKLSHDYPLDHEPANIVDGAIECDHGLSGATESEQRVATLSKQSPAVLMLQSIQSVHDKNSSDLHRDTINSPGQAYTPSTGPSFVHDNQERPEPAAMDISSLRRVVASLCGLAGIDPQILPEVRLTNGVVDFGRSHVSLAFSKYGIYEASFVSTIATALERLCTAISIVQQAGGCCDRFTALYLRPLQNVLELCTISIEDVIRLKQQFNIDIRRSSQYAVYDEQAYQTSAGIAQQILKPLAEWDSRSIYYSSMFGLRELHTIALVTQLLNVAFVAYLQGHCGSLDLFFLEEQLSSMKLCGERSTAYLAHISVSVEELTCLSSMLEGSCVIAFELRFPWDSRSIGPYDVLASVDDLIDTWGPGTMTLQPHWRDDKPERVASLALRGGIITCCPGDEYHWTKFEDFSEDLIKEGWNRFTKIRIGAHIDVNVNCSMDEANYLAISAGRWQQLGTRPAFWRHQEKQMGLQGGQYVNVVYNSTMNKVPGISLKVQLIANLQKRIEYYAFLSASCGLQVSFCSGLARRISMRELLADLLPIFIHRQAAVPESWHKLVGHYDVIQNLSSDDFSVCQAMFCRMSESDPACFESFWSLALELVKSLEFTGLQPTGDDFVLGFVPTDASEPLLQIPFRTRGNNLWLKVLRDSDSCATFAYITPNCLQMGGHGCRNLTQSWQGQIHFLQTNVERQLTGLSTCTVPADNWYLKDKETHFFRAKDDDKEIVLSATVVRSAAIPEPRLLVKESKIPLHIITRMFRRQDQRYLQEKLTARHGAQRAFITSSLEAAPWFT